MIKTRNKWIIGIVVVLLIIGLIVYANNQKKEEITIGALYPLSGGLAQYGEVAQKSAEIAVDDINSVGGNNGKKLVVDYQDHQCNSQTALSLFKQMNSVKKISIFSSAACSGTALAIIPVLNDSESLLLGTITTTPKLSGSSPYFFRNWASDDKEAKIVAEEIKKKNISKLGIIYEETDYAKGLKLSLEKYLNNTNIKIISDSFTSDSKDIRTQLSKLKSDDVDAIFLSPQTVTTGDIILKQMEELSFQPNIIFINDNILKSWTLLQTHTAFLENSIGTDYVPNMDKAQEFLKKYKEKYGIDCPQPNVGASIYDAISLLAQAIKEKGNNAEGVRYYLSSVNYPGISGNISFDSNNDRNNAEYTLFVVKGGKAVQIK